MLSNKRKQKMDGSQLSCRVDCLKYLFSTIKGFYKNDGIGLSGTGQGWLITTKIVDADAAPLLL